MINSQVAWKSQARPSDEDPERIMYTFQYKNRKRIGDSLTAVDWWLHTKSVDSAYIHVTNVFVENGKSAMLDRETYCVCDIPAWADPEVWLESFEPSLRYLTEHRRRIVVASLDGNWSISELSVERISCISNYFIGATFIESPRLESSMTLIDDLELGDKADVFELATTLLPSGAFILVVVTRTNYTGKDPIQLSVGLLSSDHVRVYQYDPNGYAGYNTMKIGKNMYSIKCNRDLAFEMLRKRTPTCVLLRNGRKIYRVDGPETANFLVTLNPATQNISYTTVLDNYGRELERVCRLYLYKAKGMWLLPIDRVIVRNAKEATITDATVPSEKVLVTTINGYPFFCVGVNTSPLALPPHLRALAFNLQDTRGNIQQHQRELDRKNKKRALLQ